MSMALPAYTPWGPFWWRMIRLGSWCNHFSPSKVSHLCYFFLFTPYFFSHGFFLFFFFFSPSPLPFLYSLSWYPSLPTSSPNSCSSSSCPALVQIRLLESTQGDGLTTAGLVAWGGTRLLLRVVSWSLIYNDDLTVFTSCLVWR